MSDTIDRLVEMLHDMTRRHHEARVQVEESCAMMLGDAKHQMQLRADLAAAQKRAEEAHDLTAGVSPEYKDAFDIVCDALKGTPYPVGPGKSLPHQVRALIADLQAQQPDDLARKACEACYCYFRTQESNYGRPNGQNERAIYDIGSALAARAAKGGA